MELLRDGIIAMLAAVGLTAILWAIVGVLWRLRKSDTLPSVTLVMARGNAEAMEQTVRALRSGAVRRIAIVDCGMSERARQVAYVLLRGDDVELWQCSEIEEKAAALLMAESHTGEREKERWKNEAP